MINKVIEFLAKKLLDEFYKKIKDNYRTELTSETKVLLTQLDSIDEKIDRQLASPLKAGLTFFRLNRIQDAITELVRAESILGIYRSLEIPKHIEPLLIYIRDVDLIPESIVDEILKEWKDEHAVNASTEAVRWGNVVTEINQQFTVKKENNPDFDIEEGIRNSRHILLDENLSLKGYIDAVKTYEDDIFAGHYGFLLNLYHFLSTYDREANANAISKIYYKLKRATAPFIDDIDEEFKERMKYLRPLDILRFDASVISLFIPIFDDSRVVGDSSTVI